MNTRHILGFVAALSLNAGAALAFSELTPVPATSTVSLESASAAANGSLPDVVIVATRLPREPRW